jgi:aspartyl-tRNA synthetase
MGVHHDQHLDAHAPVRRAPQRAHRPAPSPSAAGSAAAASTASTSPSSTCATTPASCSAWSTTTRRAQRVRRAHHRRGAGPPRGHRSTPNLATGEIEIGECTVEVLSASRAAAVPDRRSAPTTSTRTSACVPLPRPAPGADAAQPPRPLRRELRHARAMERQGFVEVETPMLMPVHPEGAREFLVPSRKQPRRVLRAAAVAPAVQAAADGGRHRPLLPDRPLPARRGPARRPPVRVHAARRRDELRRPGRRARAISEAVLDAAEAVTGERPAPPHDLARGDGPLRHRQARPALRHGARRAHRRVRGHRVQGVRRCRRHQGHPGARRAPRSSAATSSTLTDRAKKLGAKGLVWLRSAADGLESPVAKFLSETERGRARAARPPSRRPAADRGRRVDDHLRGARARSATTSAARRCTRARTGTCGSSTSRCSSASTRRAAVPSRATTRSPAPPRRRRQARVRPDVGAVPAYDLVLNGWELGSGSIRIHESDSAAADLRPARHRRGGGQAFGFFLTPVRVRRAAARRLRVRLDRLVAILAGEENIREVIAFPKTQSGRIR